MLEPKPGSQTFTIRLSKEAAFFTKNATTHRTTHTPAQRLLQPLLPFAVLPQLVPAPEPQLDVRFVRTGTLNLTYRGYLRMSSSLLNTATRAAINPLRLSYYAPPTTFLWNVLRISLTCRKQTL